MIDTQYGIAIMGGREVSRPYRVCFSPKASGFYPWGDATALAGEGSVGDVVCLKSDTPHHQRQVRSTGIAKRLFFMFLFQSPCIFPLNHFLTDAPAAQI